VSGAKRISIIIPAYNEERYLKRCLDSIAALSESPYEVLVVDNNSTDATAQIATSYPFVRLLHEKLQGRVYARNTGFDAAKGDILARIDADAVLPADWTTAIGQYFDQAGALETSWTGAALFYNVRFPHIVSGIYNALVFRFNLLLAGHPTLWGSNMAVPKRLWQEVKNDVCLRNDVHEDLDLAIHLHRHGRRIHYTPRVKVHVQLRRVHANHHELWDYLQMWPRTLQVHGLKTWPICWLFGDVLLYIVSPLFGLSERVARLFGRKPLED
jgi:cellulose synthase/poly-beta-1,6-N-acetylglucosamine synthase-like glycosyltransferase